MKKFVLTILFVYISIIQVKSQSFFEINYGDTLRSENLIDVLQTDDESLIFIGYSSANYDCFPKTDCGIIIKLNSNGHIQQIKEITKQDSNIRVYSIEKFNENFLITGCIGDTGINSNENLFIAIIDENLNIINEINIFYSDSLELKHLKLYSEIFDHKNLIISGFKKHIPSDYLYGFVLKINLLDFSINKYYRYNNYSIFFRLIRDYSKSKYIVFSKFINNSFGERITLDTNLNIISTNNLPDNLGNVNYTVNISDTTYLLTGINYTALLDTKTNLTKGNLSQRWDMGLLLMNQYHEKINFFSFGKPGDTLDIPGMYKNIDYVYKDAIYYGGTCDFYPIYFPGDKRPFMLIKMDSNVNVIWQKFYLTESCNELNNVLATRDGGCVLMGKKINFPATLDYDANAVIIKVDADGNFVSINEKEKIQITAQEAIVYPNPCLDKINVRVGMHISKPAQLQIFSANSQKVLTTIIHDNFEEITIAQLNAGVYFYSLTVDNKTIGSGKFIKQ